MAHKQLFSGLKNGVYNFRFFVCDTENDLDLLPTSTKRGEDYDVCSAGSEAIVISSRKCYMLNNDDEWCMVIDYASGGEGKSINFYKIHTEYVDGDWVIKDDDGTVQTFADIDAAFKNPSNFVYMVHTNIVMIPAFDETTGFEFTGQYKLNGNISNVRVIINDQNEVHVDDDYLEQTMYKADSMEDWDFEDPDAKLCYPTVEAVLNYISQHISLASNGKAGLVMGGGAYGFNVTDNGVPECKSYGTSLFWDSNVQSAAFISKGTLNYVLTSPSKYPALTEEEQAAARARIGILSTEGVDF